MPDFEQSSPWFTSSSLYQAFFNGAATECLRVIFNPEPPAALDIGQDTNHSRTNTGIQYTKIYEIRAAVAVRYFRWKEYRNDWSKTPQEAQ